ncbi:response regulator [Halochromatium sp.]
MAVAIRVCSTLLVEDDRALGSGLRSDLVANGYAVDWALDGIDVAFLGSDQPYDAIVLDPGLPKKPGLEVLRDWRANGLHTQCSCSPPVMPGTSGLMDSRPALMTTLASRSMCRS